MAATLLLLRHAKSAWPSGVEDRERPLTGRGTAACAVMGRLLAANGWLPDRVVASPARRAQETATLVLGAAGCVRAVTTDERLYGGDVAAVLAEHLAPGVTLLVGHEPELVSLCRALSGAEVALPTAAIVVLEVAPSGYSATLRALVAPKMLAAGG